MAGAIHGPIETAASEHFQTQTGKRAQVAVFWESGFPSMNGCDISQDHLRQALEPFEAVYLSERDLIDQLNNSPLDLLVTPYGSAFPKRAWSALFQFLRGGGNWVNIGGVPLAVPVNRNDAQWQAEPRQTAYHKRLGITQSFSVEAHSIVSYESNEGHRTKVIKEIEPREIYELYVRFTSSSYFPDEVGSDGPREASLVPLMFGVNRDGRRMAAPIIRIDRLVGDFRGGRWILANFRGRIAPDVVRSLAACATEGAIEFIARSDFACYRDHETPSFSIQVHRPKGDLDKIISGDCRINVRDSENRTISQQSINLEKKDSTAVGNLRLGNETKLAPGFYQIHALQPVHSATGDSPGELTYTGGFWIYDDSLMNGGRPLTVDNHLFYRDGQPFPVTGTTYMASDVHRQFLFDPNPFLWDRDFREMKAAGVNMIRTGIWTGWKKYMTSDGVLNEVALRALDAFLLTARRHDIPVIFTFFAFLPETWGGENAYLDPLAVRAQQKFISVFTDRYRGVNDLIWDFINEPSFCSPKHLWSCRPNYDKYEKAEWQDWLKERYPYDTKEGLTLALQRLWRTTGDGSLDLPRLEDFESRHIFDNRAPLKTLDYRLFAQDMFARWVKTMTKAIRSNGNLKQLITVGQDEAGLNDSPNPQLFADTVDFSSLHNWWNNDDLVWDNALAKPLWKANLIQETGVMFYEKMDGSAWRTEQEARNLLERKMAISLGADGAGFIQWIWNTNCYINSDNEAAIGFHRADGTAKPELEPFLDLAKQFAKHAHLMRGLKEPEVLMVIPHSQMFSPRNFATEATRKCVHAMYYHCRTSQGTVSEYRLHESSAAAKLILVPSPRVLTQKCWEALVKRVEKGATVAVSGILDADAHWLPVERAERLGWLANSEPVSNSEFIAIADREYEVRFEGEKVQRIEKAIVQPMAVIQGSRLPTTNPRSAQVLIRSHGAGRFIWSPLPLELGDSTEALVAYYRFALQQAGVSSGFKVTPDTPSLLILPSVFEKAVLYTIVSETNCDLPITLQHLETSSRVSLNIPAKRAALVWLDRRSGEPIPSMPFNPEPL